MDQSQREVKKNKEILYYFGHSVEDYPRGKLYKSFKASQKIQIFYLNANLCITEISLIFVFTGHQQI